MGATESTPPDLGPILVSVFERADQWFAEERHLFEWDGTDDGSLASVCEQLLYHNLQVWHNEDYGRTQEQRLILIGWHGAQNHNKARNVAINAIDALFAPLYLESAELHTETIGAIVDRLTIQYLKYKNYLPRCAATAVALRQHIDELVACTQKLQGRIAAGEVRCHRLPRIKLYLEESSVHP